MRRAALKLLAAFAFVALLAGAIGFTENESPWLVAWFLLFFFAGIPVALLSLSDFASAIFHGRGEGFRGWIFLHVCAVFAAGAGLLLGQLAKASEHPKADLHQWLILVLPSLVYLAPVLLALHSGDFGFPRSLTRGSSPAFQ